MSAHLPLSDLVSGLDTQLSVWAARHGRRLPGWTHVLVIGEENGHRVGPWVDIDTFEFRFASILDRTARDWVNVHVESIEAGALKLVVEYRTDAAGVPRTWTAAEISVNLSGPIKSWWDGLPVSE